MKFPHLSIPPSRLLVGFGVALIVALAITASVIAWRQRAGTLADADRDASNLSLVLAEQTSTAIRSVDDLMFDAIDAVRISGRGGGRDGLSGEAVHKSLRNGISTLPQALSLFVVDGTGKPIHSSRSFPPPDINSSDRSYFIAHRDNPESGLFISEPRRSRAQPDKWSFFLSRRISGARGELEAVVVASVDLDYFEAIYRALRLPEGSSIGLFHRNGVALAMHPHDDAIIGKVFASPRIAANAMASPAQAGATGQMARLHDPETHIVKSRALGVYPLLISVAIPEAEVLAPWRTRAGQTAIGTLGAALVVAMLIILLVQQFARRERQEKALATSEWRYRALVETMNEGLGVIDSDGVYTYVNDRLCKMFGYGRDELIGQTVVGLGLLDDANRAIFVEQMKLRAEGGQNTYEMEYIRKDGTRLRALISPQPIVDENGAVRGSFAVITDVTELKHAEEEARRLNEELERRVGERTAELAKGEARLRAIFDNSPMTISLKDTDGRYRMINRKFRELFGKTDAEVIGMKPTDFFDKDVADDTLTHDRDVITSEKAIEREERIQVDDVTLSISTVKFPIFDKAGKMTGLGSMAIDISERKRLEDELLRKERLAAMGQLTATVAHELRNPLGAVSSSIAVIRQKSKGAGLELERSLARADRGIRRCDTIVTELLDFARAKGLQTEPVPLDTWLSEVLEELDIPPRIDFRVDLELDGAHVLADRDTLRRAVVNVIDNACEAMTCEADGNTTARGALTVTTRAGDNRIEIEVRDTGAGIPANILPRVMEPLFSTKSFGTGLGLPTVQRIMEEHGGGLEVHSDEGRGTRVTLWLPVEMAGAETLPQ